VAVLRGEHGEAYVVHANRVRVAPLEASPQIRMGIGRLCIVDEDTVSGQALLLLTVPV
jgi:hypothetical protein